MQSSATLINLRINHNSYNINNQFVIFRTMAANTTDYKPTPKELDEIDFQVHAVGVNLIEGILIDFRGIEVFTATRVNLLTLIGLLMHHLTRGRGMSSASCWCTPISRISPLDLCFTPGLANFPANCMHMQGGGPSWPGWSWGETSSRFSDVEFQAISKELFWSLTGSAMVGLYLLFVHCNLDDAQLIPWKSYGLF